MTTDELTDPVTDTIRWASPPPRPSKHEALIDPDALHRRRKTLRVLTVAAAGVAMFASGWGMWTFFSDLPRLNHWYLILPMFLLFDLAAVACAWGARINRLAYGRMGIEGWLVWLFATASGLMSASDADGRAAVVRFAAPMVAAILFELLIRGERRDLTNVDGPLARIRRRTLARFGLLDDVDQDDEQAARARTAAKLATAAYRVHQTRDGSRARRRALRRYHRRLQTASVRMGFATDADMIDDVRIHLDALYRSVTGTAPDAVADLNVWQSTAPREVAAVAQEAAPAFVALPEIRTARIRAVRRSRRPGRLAGRPRTPKPAQATPAPVTQPAPAPVQVAALNGHARPADQVRAPIEKKPAPRKPAASPAKRSGADTDEQAWRFWQSEQAAGRTPSAAQIGAHIGASKSTGGRLLKQFRGATS